MLRTTCSRAIGPRPATVYPSYGSVVAKMREAKRGALPPYVAVPDAPIFVLVEWLPDARL